MRILHLGEVAGVGGLQNWICSLAETQSRKGHEVHLMQSPWIASGSQVFSSLPVHSWDIGVVKDFDVAHSHGISGYENPRIRKIPGRPPIVHSYYGTVLGIQIALRWFQNLVGWNGPAVPRNIWREAVSGLAADAVIANSDKVRFEIAWYYGVRKGKVTVIPAGYRRHAPATFAERQATRLSLGLPQDGFLFLFVGRDDPVKNLRAALHAFQSVRARFPQAYLVIAPKQPLPAVEGIVTLELPPQEMARLFQAVDVLVHPAFYEAYSVAIHEALAYGLPAVISRDTGIADYCTDGREVLLLPRRRSAMTDALAGLMCSLIESEPLRQRLSEAALKKFGSMDWDWVAERTEQVYSSVCKKKLPS